MIEKSWTARSQTTFTSRWKRPRFHPRRVVVVDIADLALSNELGDLPDRARIDEGVIHHQDAAAPRGLLDQMGGGGDPVGDGLLDEDVLSGHERGNGDLVMAADRRRDHHGVDLGIGHEVAPVGHEAGRRMPPRGAFERPRRKVRDHFHGDEARIGRGASEVRPPVAISDDADADHGRASVNSGAGAAPEPAGMRCLRLSAIADVADDAGRVAGDDCVVRHVARDHRARADEGARADGDPADDRRVRADRGPAPHQGWLAFPVAVALQGPVRVSGLRHQAVGEHDAVADEDLVLERHSLADEGMGGDLAAGADGGALLDLDEGTDAAARPDLAPVEVHEVGMGDDDVIAKIA